VRDNFVKYYERRKKIMKAQEGKIFVQEVREEVMQMIRENIVATYAREGSTLVIRFLNGQKFRVQVEEEE
jgi:hypothetical protein